MTTKKRPEEEKEEARVYTVRQVAEKLAVSPSLVYDLCRGGLLRHTRHGRPGRRGVIRIAEGALEDYLKSCDRTPPPGQDGELTEAGKRRLERFFGKV